MSIEVQDIQIRMLAIELNRTIDLLADARGCETCWQGKSCDESCCMNDVVDVYQATDPRSLNL